MEERISQKEREGLRYYAESQKYATRIQLATDSEELCQASDKTGRVQEPNEDMKELAGGIISNKIK